MRKSKAHRYRFELIAILSMLCFYSTAQSFRYKATLDSVQQSGFYTILLSPAIVAECQPQFRDIRIKDNADKEIPYIVKQQKTALAITNIITLPVIKTNHSGKVILQNSGETGTDELILFIKNASATRTVTLSGSDDTSHWYVIKENIVLAKDNNGNDETSFIQIIHFPYSKYRYFQISMQGKESLPLNIFKAGVYHITNTANNSFNVLPQPAIIQHDSSDKKSYIQLLFDKYYQVNKLRFSLSGVKFFNRSFTLYNGNSINNLVLDSGNVNSRDSSITLNLQVKTNKLLLVVNNLDNALLHINRFTAYQLPIALIAYLDAGKKYNLFFGDSTLGAPAYDLQYFSDSIRANTNLLAIKTIEKMAVPAGTKTNVDNHLHTWLLWSIIIAVLLLLIYFSFALLKDINRKTTNTDAHL